MLSALARSIHRRRWLVLAVWAVLLAGAIPLAFNAEERLKPGGFTSESFPSIQAWDIFQERLNITPVTLELLLRHPELKAYDSEFLSVSQSVISLFEEFPEVTRITSHINNPVRVSADGHTAYITIELALSLEDSVGFTEDALALIETEPLELIATGGPALYRDLSVASAEDLRRGEAFALPLAAIALVIVFGTLVAALTPVAVGGAGTALGLAGIFLLSGQVNISIFALNIASLLAVGVGIDYCLFYTARFREELRKGLSTEEALSVTTSKAGPAILFSAFTSLTGLLSLLLFETPVLRSIGIGAAIAIFAAMFTTFTLLPAVLSVLGGRVERFRVPFPSLKRNGGRRISFWRPVSLFVMKHPLAALLPTVVLLVFLTLPVLQLRLGTVDATILPEEFESRRGFDIITEEFGLAASAQTAIAYTFEGDPFEEANLRNLYEYGVALENLEGVTNVTSFVNLDPHLGAEDYIRLYAVPESVSDRESAELIRSTIGPGVAAFFVSSEYQAFSPESQQLATEMRALTPEHGKTYVAGGPAGAKDIVDSLYSTFPWVILAVAGITYLSLLVLFRSVVLAFKAVILNIMSIGASYGALVFVFQQGNFKGLLGFEPAGIIEFTTPIVLFAVIFGLSMDYEIFLLSRVSEAHKRGHDNAEAVATGLEKSGRVITGAGAILIIVAASFVMADVLVVQMLGFGLALAIFIDVTLVRIIAAPAIMRLAGRWNWYFPKWLDKLLPRFGRVG